MKTITINAFGVTRTLRVLKGRYAGGNLGIILEEEVFDEELGESYFEPFGVVTVNLAPWDDRAANPQDEAHAFVKNWSENEGWAEEAARAIGGKPTDTVYPTGYVTARLWDFSGVDWED